MSEQVKWTNSEIKVLKNGWLKLSKSQLFKVFPGRSWSAIRQKSKKSHIYKVGKRPYPPPFDRFPLIKSLSEIEKAQLAMMIDCEGSIGIFWNRKYRGWYPRISFSNTNKKIIKFFKKLTSCGKKISIRKEQENRKSSYRISISSMPLVYLILEEIIHSFIIKNAQAKLLLEFIKIQDKRSREIQKKRNDYSKRQLYIVKKLHKLNQRGDERQSE